MNVKTGLFVDDDEMGGIHEALKVFPSAIKKKPNVKSKHVEVELKVKQVTERTGTIVPPAQMGKRDGFISSLPGYREMMEGLEKDKEWNHSEAMKLYERAGELGNKGGFMNMGNCYLFGKGVGEDKRKGIEMWKKCGKIEESEVRWMRKLSNDRFMCGEDLDLHGLFQ